MRLASFEQQQFKTPKRCSRSVERRFLIGLSGPRYSLRSPGCAGKWWDFLRIFPGWRPLRELTRGYHLSPLRGSLSKSTTWRNPC